LGSALARAGVGGLRSRPANELRPPPFAQRVIVLGCCCSDRGVMSDRAALRVSNGWDVHLTRAYADSQRQLTRATSGDSRLSVSTRELELHSARGRKLHSARGSRSDAGSRDEEEEIESLLDEREDLQHDLESLDETTYGFAITSLVRDSVWVVAGQTEATCIRMGRLATSFILIFMTSALQLYVLYQVARLLCGHAVEEMRATYVAYEEHMYPDHTEVTAKGYVRGIVGHIEFDLWETMDEQLREDICNIPLAHPWFLSTILLIWTLTCLKDVRRVLNQAVKILYVTPTVNSLVDLDSWDEHKVEIVGLTWHLKAAIFGIMTVRGLTIWGLLWLGCRWLTATVGLDEMFLNGLALEFVLVLQELLYAVLVPHRHQIATMNTLILPLSHPGKEKIHFLSFFGSLIWLLVAILYVCLYVFWTQSVLPDFRWDVRDVCDARVPQPRLF